MKHIVGYKGGNALSYSEYGDRNGYPILVQHGLIASISDYRLFDSLIGAGRRLLSVARPGYGESSPYREVVVCAGLPEKLPTASGDG